MSNPRIIAGSAKGIRLKSVPGNSTRPITDRVKESLFSIIGGDIIGSSMLDVFAGTGSVGLEALSRGASIVRFLDLSSAAIKTIKANLGLTHLDPSSQIIQTNSHQYLLRPSDMAFDYVYIAPPQYKGLWVLTLQILEKNLSWLSDDGWIIVQIDPIEYSEQTFSAITLIDKRFYGNTLLAFFMRIRIKSDR